MSNFWVMKRIAVVFLLMFLAAGAVMAQQPVRPINKKNLVVKEWNTDVKTNRKVLDHVVTYNAEGRKVEEIEYSQIGQKWRKRYEYGSNGKCSKELVYNERNQLVLYKTFTYNEYGRKKVQYTYDAKGKLLSTKHFEYILSDAK